MNKAVLLIVGLTGVNALAAYWWIGTPTAPLGQVEDSAEFQLPELPAADDTVALYQQLRQRQAWGPEGEAGAAPSASSYSGRFAGVVYEGGEPHMLILDQGKLSRFAAGADLPDKARVVSVAPDRVEIERGGERETLRLYHQ